MMRNDKLMLVAAVGTALMAATARADNAAGVDTSDWACESCPFQKDYEARATLGVLYVDEDSAKFGEYNGLDEKGAYAELPRYFSDADKVMDLESRLLHCMVTLQGFSRADATKRVFGSGSSRSDYEALAAWITSESRGVVMKVSLNHQKMQEAFSPSS